MRPRNSLALVLAAAAAFAARESQAQVPDGWYVVSSFFNYSCSTYPTTCASEGGRLFFVHPRSPSIVTAPIEVTGLGCDLTGEPALCGVTLTQGANCVLRRPSDGALIVGEQAPAGASVDLHILSLAGATVATDIPYSVGTAGPGGTLGIVQSALLANGEVLVGVNGIAAGPLAGSILGIVSENPPPAGTVTALPVSPPSPFPPGAFLNAVAVDGTTAYFGMVGDPAQCLSTVYGVAVSGGSATPLATTAGAVANLAVDGAGQVLASFVANPCGAPPDNLVRIDPSNGTVTPIDPPIGVINAVAVERVTGNLALVTGNVPGGSSGTAYWATPAGAAAQLTFYYLGWWGAKSGIDVNPDPEAYGAGTCGSKYAWALAPNPGGLPEVGNGGFSLTVTSVGSPAPGLFAVSLASANGVVLGVDVLVDLAQLVVVGSHPGTISLPIPPLAGLLGARVLVQSFHVDACGPMGIAASDGVEVSVL